MIRVSSSQISVVSIQLQSIQFASQTLSLWESPALGAQNRTGAARAGRAGNGPGQTDATPPPPPALRTLGLSVLLRVIMLIITRLLDIVRSLLEEVEVEVEVV